MAEPTDTSSTTAGTGCRYCGSNSFYWKPSVTWDMAQRSDRTVMPFIRNDLDAKATIGILICRSCGHMEFFMAEIDRWAHAVGATPMQR